MSFGDYPTTEDKKIPYKLIGIVGAGILLAVVIIGMVLRFVNKDDANSVDRVEKEATRAVLDECDQATSPEGCRAAVVKELSARSGDVAFCRELEGREVDGCIWAYATDHADPSVCDEVADSGIKEQCKDTAHFAVARSTSDATNCDKIKSESFKAACIADLQPPLTTENCLTQGRDPAYCEMITVSEQALQKQDREVCNTLGDIDRILLCEDRVQNNDPDFDNIDTALESFYGTDPRNADSDGDGFKDGDEVEAGYNPNGPGTLETPSENKSTTP